MTSVVSTVWLIRMAQNLIVNCNMNDPLENLFYVYIAKFHLIDIVIVYFRIEIHVSGNQM